MDSKSLMIGDWVYHFDKPLKITDGIYRGRVYTKSIDISEERLNPIPLTAEILEKNWFEKYAMYHTLHDKQVRIEYYWHESRLEIQPYDGEPWIKLSPLRYVHELQHAFRLCGLNELADNFVV